MSNKTHKKTDTKVKGPSFIKFSEIQKKYLNEVRTRQVDEFNAAVDAVCKELGLVEKLKQAPPGMYRLRLSDLSGLDVVPPPPQKPDPPAEDPKDIKPPEKETEPQK